MLGLAPARQLSYEEARDDIRDYLSLVKKQQYLLDYLAGLRSNAEILSYVPQGQG